jgi:hypothetical protein
MNPDYPGIYRFFAGGGNTFSPMTDPFTCASMAEAITPEVVMPEKRSEEAWKKPTDRTADVWRVGIFECDSGAPWMAREVLQDWQIAGAVPTVGIIPTRYTSAAALVPHLLLSAPSLALSPNHLMLAPNTLCHA